METIEKKQIGTKAYTYALGTLESLDSVISTLSYRAMLYPVYQGLIDLFAHTTRMNEADFAAEVLFRMSKTWKQFDGDYPEIAAETNKFVKIGCSIQELSRDEIPKLFQEIRNKRNNLLKERDTLRAYLLYSADIEHDGVYTAHTEKLTGFFADSFNSDENFQIELKKGTHVVEVEEAISQYYTGKGYAAEIDDCIKIKKEGKIEKIISISMVPGWSIFNPTVFISINENEFM